MDISLVSLVKHYGIWVSIPLCFATLALLVFGIVRAIKLVKAAYICSVPLQERQEVEFSEPGQVALWVQGPQAFLQPFAKRVIRLGFELHAADGGSVECHRSLLNPHTSSFSWVRIQWGSIDIPAAGRYLLQAHGLETAQLVGPKHQIVFTRPYMGRLVGPVLLSVLGGLLLWGSIALFVVSLHLMRS